MLNDISDLNKEFSTAQYGNVVPNLGSYLFHTPCNAVSTASITSQEIES